MRWIAAISLIGIGWLSWHTLAGSQSGSVHSAVPNLPAAAASGQRASRVFAAGIVEGLQSPLELRFETSGRVTAVRVREGEQVRANQVLAELDSEMYDLRVIQAEANWQLAVAERERLLGRQRSMENQASERLALPAQPRLTSEDQVVVEARITAAEAVLKQERLLRQRAQLKAPIDGLILAVNLKPGEMAGSGPDAGTIVMVNRTKTRVRGYVEELDAMRVGNGQKVAVVAPGREDQPYLGTIVACAPYVEPKSHRHLNPGERLDVRVRAILVELENGADLLIGLPVELFIELQPLAIPGKYPAR